MTADASTYAVDESDAGARLDVFLAARLGESRSQSAARIARGEVTVGGEPAAKSRRLVAGETVQVQAPPREPTGAAGVQPPPIRYEDEHLLVVAKPAGLVVHPGAGHRVGTLVQALAEAGVRLAAGGDPVRPGIVHRLDRDTSGLLVVAKTEQAYAGLVAALQGRTVHRRYLALLEGEPVARARIDAPIGRHPEHRRRFAVVADGKPAVTHLELLDPGTVGGVDPAGARVALVACRLETGRTHQIRVHVSAAGHPVVGDRTYGARRDLAAALGLDRPFLHAAELGFDHPVTGARLDLSEPLPADLTAALARTDLTA